MAIGSGKRFQYFTEQISGAGVGRTRATWRFWHRPVSPRPNPANKIALPLFEIARVLVRLDHIARFRVNADHSQPNIRRILSWLPPIRLLTDKK
jgi:hypothetical protein